MIYHDPTEGRSSTALSQELLAQYSNPLPGLERLTGADFLVTVLESPIPDLDTVPGEVTLRKHTEKGALVQRKSGSDMLNSIPRLSHICAKMLEWTSQAWLVPIGQFTIHRDMMVVNGRHTNWHASAFFGAIEKWQFMGGHYPAAPLSSDDAMFDILRRMEQRFLELPLQHLKPVIEDSISKRDPYPERATLMTLPHIGAERSLRIMEHTGSLWASLTLLTLPYDDLLEAKKKSLVVADFMQGIGPKANADIRRWLGLEETDFAIGLYVDKEPT